MDIQQVMTFIGSVGFPIVACLGLGWYIKYQADQHRDETKALTDVISHNTIVLEGIRQLLQDKMKEDLPE